MKGKTMTSTKTTTRSHTRQSEAARELYLERRQILKERTQRMTSQRFAARLAKGVTA